MLVVLTVPVKVAFVGSSSLYELPPSTAGDSVITLITTWSRGVAGAFDFAVSRGARTPAASSAPHDRTAPRRRRSAIMTPPLMGVQIGSRGWQKATPAHTSK